MVSRVDPGSPFTIYLKVTSNGQGTITVQGIRMESNGYLKPVSGVSFTCGPQVFHAEIHGCLVAASTDDIEYDEKVTVHYREGQIFIFSVHGKKAESTSWAEAIAHEIRAIGRSRRW